MPTAHTNAPITPGAVNLSDLISTVAWKSPRVATVLAAGQAVYPLVKKLRDQAAAKKTYTVKVLFDDEIFNDLHEYVLSLLPEDRQRALIAWTARREGMASSVFDSEDSEARQPSRVRLRYDGSTTQEVDIKGHAVKVVVSIPEGGGQDSGYGKKPELIFTAYSYEGREAVLEAIDDVARYKQQSRRRPKFRMLNTWGDWEAHDELAERTLDSVILPDDQLQRIIADLQAFMDSEEDYLRRCIPWHRGYFFDGPPGTGKTSVARAIANHFGMDVWYMPLADVKTDSNLLSLVNRVTPRSMLLLEDVDVFHAATARKEDEGKPSATLSGLLNALDGIATPHGLVKVMTSNDPSALDAALVRPGRIDVREHFGHANDEQISRILTRWYAEEVRWHSGGLPRLTPAQVIEVCKQHDTPAQASMAVYALYQETTARGAVG